MSSSLTMIPDFFSELSGLLPRFAVLNRDLQTLHVHCTRPEDLMTLPWAARQTMQFFKLNEGDLVVLNDPSCGGLGAGGLTWVTVARGFVIAFRQSHPTPWSMTGVRKDEGLRIPPSPLRMNGTVNSIILEALCSQGVASSKSEQFKTTIYESLEIADLVREKILKVIQLRPEVLDKEIQKKYLVRSRDFFLKKLLDRVHGETRCELTLRTGEILKLRLQAEESSLKIDFSGTSQGQKLFIPELWVQSASIAFVMDQAHERTLFNEGTFSAINIVKPQQSFLNAKNQQPLGPAQHLGVPTLWTALHYGFYDLQPKAMPAPHDYFPLKIQWTAQESLHEFSLPSGTGAFRDRESWSGALIDKEIPLNLAVFNQSQVFDVVELHERKLKAQKNPSSGGSGWSLKLIALTDVDLFWYGNNIKSPGKIPKTLTQPESAELLINKETQEICMGKKEIKEGDEVILNSGQGSGFAS